MQPTSRFVMASILCLCARIASAQSQFTADQLMGKLQAPPAFTLTYAVTIEDIRSPSLRQADVDYQKMTGSFSQDGTATKPMRSLALTLCGNGESFMIRTVDPLQPPSAKDVVDIYNGQDLRECSADSKHPDANIFPNYNRVLDKFPIPGISIPQLPILENAVLTTSSGNRYQLTGRMAEGWPRGILNVTIENGVVRAHDLVIYVAFKNHVGNRWHYNDWVDVGGVQVASDLVDIENGAILNNPADFPATRIHYHLLSSSSDSNPRQFDLTYWLRQGDPVGDCRKQGKPCISFNYDPSKGSLDRQIDLARLDMQRRHAELKSGRMIGTMVTGTFLVIALGLFTGSWIWRRGTMTSR